MFTSPKFNVFELSFAAIGAGILFTKLGFEGRKIYVFSELMDTLPIGNSFRVWLEFFLFVGFGAYISIGIVGPTTPVQAIAAGFGWTGLLSTSPDKTNRARKGRQREN